MTVRRQRKFSFTTTPFIIMFLLVAVLNGCAEVTAEETPPVTPSPIHTAKLPTPAATLTPMPTPTPQPTTAKYERLGLNPQYKGALLTLPEGYTPTTEMPPQHEWYLSVARETVDIDGIIQRLWDGQGGIITEFGNSEAPIGYSLYPTLEDGVDAIGHNEYIFVSPNESEVSYFSYEWRMDHNSKQQSADMFDSSAPEEEYKALDRAKEMVNELLGTDSYTKNLIGTTRFKLTTSDGDDIHAYTFDWEPDGDYGVISNADNAPRGFLSATLTGDGIVSMHYIGRIKYAPAYINVDFAPISIEDAMYSINFYKSYSAEFFGFQSLTGFAEAKFGYYMPLGKAFPRPVWLISMHTTPKEGNATGLVTLAVDIETGSILDFGGASVLAGPFLRQDVQKRTESEARLRGLQEEIELGLPNETFGDMEDNLLLSYIYPLGGDFNCAGRVSADGDLAYITIEPVEPLPTDWSYEAQEVNFYNIDTPFTEILVNSTDYGKYPVYALPNVHSVIFRYDENNRAVALISGDDALIKAAMPK